MINLQNAHISKITTLSDKTMRVTLDLRELPSQEMAQLMSVYMKSEEGIIFKPEPEDIGVNKSPSQRLRAVLYLLWDRGSKEQDFETYYRSKMEAFISSLKDRL